MTRYGERRREEWDEKRLLAGHSVAMLMNAWAKKKDGSMFTATDVFPDPETDNGRATDAAADDEGQRTLAMFQAMAFEEQARKRTRS